MAVAVLSACGGENDTVEESAQADETENTSAELTEMTQVTSWFPQIESAGQYMADMEGYYEEEGIDMTTDPGGPEVSSVSIVASGNAEIGMAQGDEVLLAIEEGIPLVAVMANFQQSLQGIMYHGEHDVSDFDDLAGDFEIFTSAGAGYWEYLVASTDIEQEQNAVYSGDQSAFVSNSDAASQMYITSEPYYLDQEGVDVGTLLISDSGYENYGDVLFTTEEFYEENPELVQAYVDATVRGWEQFQEDPESVYDYVHDLADNDSSTDQMEYATEQMDEHVYGGDAVENGVGYMSEERWQQLIDQLTELGVIESGMEASDVFVSDFID
ncbi:myristoyl transferase [Alkalicoccus urumqiensis]|uniref:Thiamine pyrimidine synthase n=2 Tax=Alkalicoccus urumqiensis TaxID=1548213 RepID=A0A2P6MK68_ALKUR|nr:myristoyl transferase [Alkalicoccus urumqiensis]